MQVQLDEDIWEMNDSLRLEEVLADVSDRAQAKGRLVTELKVGHQRMTDRELIPPTLAQLAGSFGSITAKSEQIESIVQNSEETAKKFEQQLMQQAQDFVNEFRRGQGVLQKLDQWFGQMADYLEWGQIHQAVGPMNPQQTGQQGLVRWIDELMTARKQGDEVRVADLLEYEILPRLSQNVKV